GPGADNHLGGNHNDTIVANDGEADVQIHGGAGVDTATVDANLDPGTVAVENVIVDSGPPPPPPPPGGSCVYDAPSGTVNAAIPANGSATVAVVAGAIHFGETPTACGAATTANTDTITVVGQPGSVEHLTVDQTGGPLAPGATAETSGLSEVEVAANLGDATDEVTVVGTSGDDTLSAGTNGVSVNTDSDVDVTFGVSPSHLELVGGGGVNVLTGRGGSGSGTVFAGRVTLRAGDLGDRLDGGNLNDLLVGGAGPDILDAGTGDDELRGGPGADVLRGSDGNDLLVGDAGADELNGSFGNDTIEAGDGAADLLIHGGPGTDSAEVDGVDPGTIAVESVTVVAGPPPPPPPPGGACTYNPVSGVVLASTPAGAAVTLTVVGGAIHFGETPAACGEATTANTDSITVSGPSGSVEQLMIDLSGGPLAPGASDEGPNSISEIEIAVDLGEAADQVVVVGSPGDDTIAAGTKGLGLNDDRDVDVTFTVLPATFELFGGGGNDFLSARGGAGAGPLFAGPVTIHGEDGDDAIMGSDLAELLTGGAGNDTIDAGAGSDTVQGGAGDDAVTGGHGDDDLDGGPGTDQLSGNAGDDVVHADDGIADAELNGGAGTDTVFYDAGLDVPVAFEVLNG
ncbi:MAG TPA: calcium-binding protein, partial [Gaiellaceae bacterium]|nr:calcium-binding protein [Gaiellaceae bacterium]